MPTHDQWLFALTLSAALGSALVGGVFFAFSAFVMKALARLPRGEGMAAMQSINIVVLNSWFLGVLFGTGAASMAAMIVAAVRWHEAGASYLFIGGAEYLLGSLGVTILCNVPRNEALASVLPEEPAGESLWADYVKGWTAWNHVRVVASVAAALLFSFALGH
jgi:uncharacterized membrane protein